MFTLNPFLCAFFHVFPQLMNTKHMPPVVAGYGILNAQFQSVIRLIIAWQTQALFSTWWRIKTKCTIQTKTNWLPLGNVIIAPSHAFTICFFADVYFLKDIYQYDHKHTMRGKKTKWKHTASVSGKKKVVLISQHSFWKLQHLIEKWQHHKIG